MSEDADAIARTSLESAEYHARLDPERYLIPALEAASTCYREVRQHPANGCGEGRITLVAELGREIVGFIDVRPEGSPDPMHRRILYRHIVEIAVSERYQSQGIGGQLRRAAEEWGRQHGAHFGSLEYHVANTRAGKCYRNCGYPIAATIAIKRLRE